MPGFNIGSYNPISINPNREFHRSHRWVIENLGIPGAKEERLYAKSIQLPSLTFDEEKIKSGAAVDYKIAKKANWQDFTIKFYDVHGLYEHFLMWQDKIWSPKTGIGIASAYKSNVILSLTDGQGEIKQKYTAHGAYPKSVTHGELSADSSDIKMLTVAYSYDYATIELMDGGGFASGVEGAPPQLSGGGAQSSNASPSASPSFSERFQARRAARG